VTVKLEWIEKYWLIAEFMPSYKICYFVI